MQLSKKLPGVKYRSLDGKEDLRFELFDWLKNKELSAGQAIDLLALTREAIIDARRAEANKIML